MDRLPLVSTARRLAWLTIGYNLIEGLVSVLFGVADDSISLLGFGLDSFIEVFSAVIVLWRLARESSSCGANLGTERERIATRGIGLLFVLLAIVVTANSLHRLAGRLHPDTAVPGIVISALSLSFMYFLYRAKMKVALALDSKTLRSDAICSAACIWLSLVLLLGSAAWRFGGVWWADSVAAVIIALLILREGVENLRASWAREFTGCCCGNEGEARE
jgi:divalent metal cation (Fe/Co/Zn/Cd) transporter